MALNLIGTFTPSASFTFGPPPPIQSDPSGKIAAPYYPVAMTVALPAGSSPATVLITNTGPDPAWVLVTGAAASPTGSLGSAGAFSFTVSSATSIAVGQAAIGTSIQAGAYVTGISGTTITLNIPLTGVVSGTVAFVTQVTTQSGQAVTINAPVALAYLASGYLSAICSTGQGRAVLAVSVGV